MTVFKSMIIVVISLACLFFIQTALSNAEEPVHPGYPFVFDVTGKLDRISETQLVIDDSLYKLSSSTTYHMPDTSFPKLSDFQEKDRVGVILKDDQSIEIISVWLIKK